MRASAADGMAASVAFCLALAAGPARAADPCAAELGPAVREGLGDPAAWDLPAPGTWRVSRRDAGRRVAEGCGLGVIEAPLRAVREVVDAAADFDKFMPRILESDVEPVAPGVYLNRQVLDMPFPVEDRRYTVRVETGAVDTGAGIGWRARWTYVEGSGNVRESTGSWTLIQLGSERTVVVYRLLTDPGGRLPAWLVDSTAPRALRRVLASVRERVLGRRRLAPLSPRREREPRSGRRSRRR